MKMFQLKLLNSICSKTFKWCVFLFCICSSVDRKLHSISCVLHVHLLRNNFASKKGVFRNVMLRRGGSSILSWGGGGNT